MQVRAKRWKVLRSLQLAIHIGINTQKHHVSGEMADCIHKIMAIWTRSTTSSSHCCGPTQRGIAWLRCAHRLGVSRGTVTNRIAKLEALGRDRRLHRAPAADVKQDQINAWMSIAVEGNQTRRVIAELLGEPAIAILHDTNGRWDLLAQLRAENLAEMSKALERIRLIKGISNTETSIHLVTYRAS